MVIFITTIPVLCIVLHCHANTMTYLHLFDVILTKMLRGILLLLSAGATAFITTGGLPSRKLSGRKLDSSATTAPLL